jgi:hypothetical protein
MPNNYVPHQEDPNKKNIDSEKREGWTQVSGLGGRTYNVQDLPDNLPPYWSNPQRIVRYNKMIQSRSNSWRPPEWMDPKLISDAYKYLQYQNHGRPEDQWGWPSMDDSIYQALSQMSPPPYEAWTPSDFGEYDSQIQKTMGDWNNLKFWQKVMLSITPVQDDLENRPEWTNTSGQLIRALQSGISAGAISGAVLTPVAGIPIGILSFAATLHQTRTGEKLPVIGDIFGAFGILGKPAQWLEQGLGALEQIAYDEDASFREVVANLPNYLESGKLFYETRGQNLLFNAASSLSGGPTAEKGEIWAFDKGEIDPIKLDSSYGVKALDEVRDKLQAGQPIDAVMMEYQDRFGVQGLYNDYVLTTFLDPMNAMPYYVSKYGKKINKIFDTEIGNAFATAADAVQGNWLVDQLPAPLNYIPPLLNKEWRGSGGLSRIIDMTRNFYGDGYIPGLSVKWHVEKFRPIKDLNFFEKTLVGLDSGGNFRWSPDHSSQPAWAKNLSEMTPLAKSKMFMSNFTDHAANAISKLRIANGGKLDIDQVKNWMQKLRDIDENESYAAIQATLDGDGLPFSATNFNSQVAKSVKAAYNNILDSGAVDEMFDMYRLTESNRSFLSEVAVIAKTDVDDIVGRIQTESGRQSLFDSVIKNNEAFGIQDISDFDNIMKPYYGSNPVGWDDTSLSSQLLGQMQVKTGDFLVDYMGVKPKSKLKMYAGLAKKVQSLLLLGFNPRYLMYNILNNLITSADTDMLGVASYARMERLESKFGIDIDSMGLSRDLASRGEIAGYDLEAMAKIPPSKRAEYLEKLTKKTTQGGESIGFEAPAQYLSGRFEEMAKASAFANSFEYTFDKLWKKSNEEVYSSLSEFFDESVMPEVKAAFDANPGDLAAVKKAIFGIDMKTELRKSIQSTIDSFDNDAYKITGNADAYEDLLVKTGIERELAKSLDGVTTQEGIVDAINEVKSRMQRKLNSIVDHNLDSYKDYLRVKFDNDGLMGLNHELKRAENRFYTDWIRELSDKNELYGAELSFKAKNKIVESRRQLSDIAFNRNYKLLSAVAEIVDEYYSSDPSTQPLAQMYRDMGDNWASVSRDSRSLWDAYFQKVEADPEGYKQHKYDELYVETYRAVSDMTSAAHANQSAIMAQATGLMNGLLSETMAGPIFEEHSNISVDMRNQLGQLIDGFRASMDAPIGVAERRAKWNTFLTEEYIPAIQALANHDDSLFRSVIPAHDQMDIAMGYDELYATHMGNMIDGIEENLLNNMSQKYSDDWSSQGDDWMAKISTSEYPLKTAVQIGDDVFTGTTHTDAILRATESYKYEMVDSANGVVRNKITGEEFVVDGDSLGFIDNMQGNNDFISRDAAEMLYGINDTAELPSYFGDRDSFKDAYLKKVSDSIDKEYARRFEDVKKLSTGYARDLTNFTLLDYDDKTEYDEMLEVGFPYHLWYTRSMRNWAARYIDKPGHFNQYMRFMSMRNNSVAKGLPQRFEGRLSMPIAYLPKWMGQSIWFDPFSQVFPPKQFMESIDKTFNHEDEIITNTLIKLSHMVREEKITREQSDLARETMDGPVWEMAYKMAEADTDMTTPINLASTFMQPSMPITTLYHILTGKPEKIDRTPIMKASQSMQYVVEGMENNKETWFSKMLGAPASMEAGARSMLGMTPAQSVFGEWGDFYVERELFNMGMEGLINYEDVLTGMIDKSGENYEQAFQRSVDLIMLKEPGILTARALGAADPSEPGHVKEINPTEVAHSLMITLFPAGILTEGELEYKGQAEQYREAWDLYSKHGNKELLAKFYDEHPEYAARAALFIKDPKERLRNYFIGNIWDKFNKLSTADASVVKQQLGDDFQYYFLNGDTRDEDAIPIETLEVWMWQLGGKVPENATGATENAEFEGLQKVETWSPAISNSYESFADERKEKFPLWYSLQEEYYKSPNQKRFLQDNPTLKEYFDWKSRYESAHPELAPIFASQSSSARVKGYLTPGELKKFPDILQNHLYMHFNNAQELSPGGWELLYEVWEDLGKPGVKFKTWVNYELEPSFRGQ